MALDLENKLEDSIMNFIHQDMKTKFFQTLQYVKLIVYKCCEKFKHFDNQSLDELKQILQIWESEFVTSAFNEFQIHFQHFNQNEVILDEYKQICEWKQNQSAESNDIHKELIFPVKKDDDNDLAEINFNYDKFTQASLELDEKILIELKEVNNLRFQKALLQSA